MGSVRSLFLVAAALVLGLTATPVANAAPEALLDQVLADAVTDDGLPGAIAVVRDGDTVTRHSAGVSDVATGAGFGQDTYVRVGSISKTFVAAAILQLVAEGKVDLDAPIETYLPGRVRGAGIDPNAITVRLLLRHQSGLPEYFDSVTDVPAEPVSGDQLLDMALAHPAQFAPGTAMVYTNTNYIVAGLLIEAVTGTPAADEVTRRVIVPLGLRHTYFPRAEDTGLRSPFARGYEMEHGVRTDVTAFNASAAGMAGSLVSTNEDITLFLTALLAGRVVPSPQLADMMDTVEHTANGPGFRYGLGLASIDLPCGVRVWGHGGDIEGFHSLVVKPQNGPALAMTVTQSPEADDVLDDPRGAATQAFFCP
jgi:D-alanyl-D-alanine carboxypeptidase